MALAMYGQGALAEGASWCQSRVHASRKLFAAAAATRTPFIEVYHSNIRTEFRGKGGKEKKKNPFIDLAKRFETYESLARQERKCFLCTPLESFLVVESPRPDDQSETFTRGESFLAQLVDPFPAVRIVKSWPQVDLRGEFDYELAESR